MDVSFYSEKIQKASLMKSIHQEKFDECIGERDLFEAKINTLESAQAFIQKIAKQTQEQLKFQLTEIVQLALDSCWPDEYKFDVLFEIKRNRTEAVLQFLNDGNAVDPTEEDGGGAVDVASFALRLAAWSLGKTEAVIIVDEPFKWLSEDLKTKAGDIMRELADRLKIQFIMVTHIKDMVDISDKVFEVTKVNKISLVRVK